MNNIWSENRIVNHIVNALLFLMSANLFHFGQFILPIICLIIFIDGNFSFKVASKRIFILLCFFSVFFYIFSRKMGFYSTMGFCLPMAYYIGSNVNKIDENRVKYIIYIISFGMATHVVLNFIYNIYLQGFGVFSAHRHFDIWTQTSVKETITAVNYVPLIGVIYYLLRYEKNKNIKITGIMLFLIIFIYNLGLGRRTPFAMALIAFLLSIFIDIFVIKVNEKIKKRILWCSIVFVCFIVIAIFIFSLNIFEVRDYFDDLMIVTKIKQFGLNPERINIFIKAVKLAPNYLWGGQEISNIIGINIHDLWMDTYDMSGIIPFIILIICTIVSLIDIYKLIKSDIFNKEFKSLIFVLEICILMQMLLEPVMSGSSLFLIVVIVIQTSLSLLENHE